MRIVVENSGTFGFIFLACACTHRPLIWTTATPETVRCRHARAVDEIHAFAGNFESLVEQSNIIIELQIFEVHMSRNKDFTNKNDFDSVF